MMDDSLAEFLHEEEMDGADDALSVGPGERDTCQVCGFSSTDCDPVRGSGHYLKFPRKGKDFFCHVVHMLLYGEKLWAESWLSLEVVV